MKLSLFLIFLSLNLFAVRGDLKPLSANPRAIDQELHIILKEAKLKNKIKYAFIPHDSKNLITYRCVREKIIMDINATEAEWGATFYYGLQKLGFLFPHPRVQISPSEEDINKYCGKTLEFKPAFKYRGLHLHTLHPNEWVSGFLMGEEDIALDTIKWIARNSNNIVDLSLLDQSQLEIIKRLDLPFRLARNLGVHTGLAMGFALNQQNSYKLTTFFNQFFDSLSVKSIRVRLMNFAKNLPLSFFNIELGSSEYTAVDYDRSILWMNEAQKVAKEFDIQTFIKVHVSSNQDNEKYGNYNFLPKFANEDVGILPHSVHYFTLYDDSAPMYTNKNFKHILDFTLEEKNKRPTWYYPETSYWINLDIGVPLLLTDYLNARALDMKNLSQENIPGQINFTTGNELGYWLMDWTVMLLNNKEYNFDPMIGLKLLGEDLDVWKKIMNFQTKYIKNQNALGLISFENPGDELIPIHRVLERPLLKELRHDRETLISQIKLLEEMLTDYPFYKAQDLEKIKNEELRIMHKLMFLRISHARNTRMAMAFRLDKRISHSALSEAKKDRLMAQKLMENLKKNFSRYPNSFVFDFSPNPTSYQFGYGALACSLHYWKRTEYMIRDDNYSPFYLNVYDLFDIVF